MFGKHYTIMLKSHHNFIIPIKGKTKARRIRRIRRSRRLKAKVKSVHHEISNVISGNLPHISLPCYGSHPVFSLDQEAKDQAVKAEATDQKGLPQPLQNLL